MMSNELTADELANDDEHKARPRDLITVTLTDGTEIQGRAPHSTRSWKDTRDIQTEDGVYRVTENGMVAFTEGEGFANDYERLADADTVEVQHFRDADADTAFSVLLGTEGEPEVGADITFTYESERAERDITREGEVTATEDGTTAAGERFARVTVETGSGEYTVYGRQDIRRAGVRSVSDNDNTTRVGKLTDASAEAVSDDSDDGELATDGGDAGASGRWDVTEPADTSEYVPLDMANNITDERVQDRIQWVDGFGRAYADALPDSEGDDAAESGELVADGGTDPEKPASDSDGVSSTNAWANYDEVELLHLCELVREGDEVKVNERRRALTVTGVSDGADSRVVRMEGNGTWYALVVERDADGEPMNAVLKYPSGSESVHHAQVANRNAMMVSEYDQLLTEELETVAAAEHRDRMAEFVDRSPGRTWDDLSERDRTGEWTVEGSELAAVKWATYAFVAHYREGGRMGGSEETRERYQDALALWERVRGEYDAAHFAGAEFGLIGAYLDYAVEDPDIQARVPEDAVEAVNALRHGEPLPDISHLAHPENHDENANVATDGGGELVADGGVEADGGDNPRDTWRFREGEDGEPAIVRDEELDVMAEYEREDGDSEGAVTYTGPDGESVTVNPADTILGPDGEDVVTVTGFRVTTEPWLSVEAFVDLPPEKGGGVPMSPHSFAIRFLGYEDSDGFHYHVGECVAASGEELEQARWSDELETLRSVSEGDKLTWGDRSEPLTVTDTFLTFSKVVEVTGPSGATYTIEWKDGTPSVRRGGEDGRSLGRPHGLDVVDAGGE